MSGILDSKSRVIDATLTIDGRRLLAQDKFNVSFVSFTDTDVVYLPDQETGHVDPTARIYLEACNLPQDRITFEADDTGALIPIRPAGDPSRSTTGILKNDFGQSSFVAGRLTTREIQKDPRIVVKSDVDNLAVTTGQGFTYKGVSSPTTASIVFDTSLPTGVTWKYTAPGVGLPHIAYINARNSVSKNSIAQYISLAINEISSSGGPNVSSTSIDNYVYLGLSDLGSSNLSYLAGLNSSVVVLEDTVEGGRLSIEDVNGENFATQIKGILSSSFDNFSQLRILSSFNETFPGSDQFKTSIASHTFYLSKIERQKLDAIKGPASLDASDSLFSDKKASNIENFLYLPPIVKTSDASVRSLTNGSDKSNVEALSSAGLLLGNYPAWGGNSPIGLNEILADAESYGSETKVNITFDQNSIENNLLCQMFEVKSSTGRGDDASIVSKLDVIDYGQLRDVDGSSRRVFFVGKVYLDSNNTAVFLNMFTLIFSRND